MQKEKGATIQTFSITDMLQANKKKEKKKKNIVNKGNPDENTNYVDNVDNVANKANGVNNVDDEETNKLMKQYVLQQYYAQEFESDNDSDQNSNGEQQEEVITFDDFYKPYEGKKKNIITF